MSGHVFVTGASGRLGLALIRALILIGERPTGLARTQSGAQKVRELGADCLVGDLTDHRVLARGAEGARTIYHLAGGLRGKGAESAEQLNHHGTNALVAAINVHSHLESLVFTSTAAVYGDRSGLWVSEQMPPLPNTDYGRSKLNAERSLLASGLPVKIVRLASVYGPNFPFLMKEEIANGTARMPGEGGNFIPTIHVDDAALGLIHIGQHGQPSEIYHLSDTTPALLRDFYGGVHQHVGGKPVHFWSTWVPSYAQRFVAKTNEKFHSRMNRMPHFTPDKLRLFTNSVRLSTARLGTELKFSWKYPSFQLGLWATFDSMRESNPQG